eukprot:m.112472 g.112472  ORF g.112472 m.112472 type:complete len:197 (-) comp22825_c0_seq4:45-635(-)
MGFTLTADMDMIFLQKKQFAKLPVKKLRPFEEKGISCPHVAFGSTPTCTFIPQEKDKATEMHPGNFIFYDLMQEKIGSCNRSDIAVTVLTTVIGLYPERNSMLIDAGWTAISSQGKVMGYAIFKDHPFLKITKLSQETAVVTTTDGRSLDPQVFVVGKTLELFPFHSCTIGCGHPRFYVREGDHVVDSYETVRGWD